jgi:hypothetical protein
MECLGDSKELGIAVNDVPARRNAKRGGQRNQVMENFRDAATAPCRIDVL